MLKFVATGSNLLVLCLLGVWVVGGIDFDVKYAMVILVPYDVEPLLSQIYTSFQYSEQQPQLARQG
jgi:hypothetical protein